MARSASCVTSKLPAGDQQHALAALLQQLLHHTGPAADGVAVGSGAGVGAARSGPRNAALAGAAALALGYAGLTGAVELPGLALDSDGATISGGGVQPSGTSEDTTTTPQLLSALLSLAASGRDARAAQRAVTAVGFIAAGSTDTRLHMAAAKGMTLHSKHVCLHTYMAARCSSHRHVSLCMCVYVSILPAITAPPGCGQGTDECRPQYAWLPHTGHVTRIPHTALAARVHPIDQSCTGFLTPHFGHLLAEPASLMSPLPATHHMFCGAQGSWNWLVPRARARSCS